MKKHLMLICLFVFCALLTNAQTHRQDYLNNSRITDVARNYTDSVGMQLNLLYGKPHETFVSNLKNRYYPYLQPKEYVFVYTMFYDASKQSNSLEDMGYGTGRLLYDGIVYPDLYMRLDLLQNQLVVLSPDKNYNIVLDPDKIERLSLFGYQVIYKKNDTFKNFPGEGYYIELHEGENTVLKKDSYYMIKRPGEVFINRNVKYYLLKNNVYHQIKNKKSLLKALHSHRKELEQYIRDSRINFNKENIEDAIVSVVNHYEKL